MPLKDWKYALGAESTHPSLLNRVCDTADEAAWRRFDATYGNLIIGYCLRSGLQLFDAEDIRQLVMMNLARSLPGFRYEPGRGRFRDYLRSTVRHAIARQQTRHTSHETALDIDVLRGLHHPEQAADETWEKEWIRQHCRTALQTLRQTYNHRSVDVFDRLLAGESIEEVAKTLAMTPVAVRKAKQRVKDRLRCIVSAQIRDEDEHV